MNIAYLHGRRTKFCKSTKAWMKRLQCVTIIDSDYVVIVLDPHVDGT